MTLLSLDNQIAPHPITSLSNNNGYTYLFNGQMESSKLASKLKEGVPISFNDCHQSIQDFSLAIKFAPEFAKEAYYQRGIVYSMVEFFTDALQDFGIAEKLGHREAAEKIDAIIHLFSA